jgi:kynureninase
MDFQNNRGFASELDQQDELREFRTHFLFPQHEGSEVVYFTGNSLGLQPKSAAQALGQELKDWHHFGVEGHFEAKHPWYSYHEMFAAPLAKLVGAKESEVVAMNGLTTNLHLLMVSFYRPEGKQVKILCEAKAFPSDLYALKSQLRFHGIDPEHGLIALEPREGEHILRTEDVLKAMEEHADELALVMIGGVNFYTGQVMKMQELCNKAHSVGALCGFDLAHAAGNVPLQLHDWGVDFAAWCSYKYLNSGPGSVSGVFVHESHHGKDLPRFEGWWGHDKKGRFKMEPDFVAMHSAEAWQLSNAPVFAMAVHKVSLDIFMEAGLDRLREKSVLLNQYLRFIIEDISARFENVDFEIITPKAEDEHGSQLSILVHGEGRPMFDFLTAKGVVADWREPNVIRIAPVPLYNSFEDCFSFGEILTEFLES